MNIIQSIFFTFRILLNMLWSLGKKINMLSRYTLHTMYNCCSRKDKRFNDIRIPACHITTDICMFFIYLCKQSIFSILFKNIYLQRLLFLSIFFF